LKRSYIALSALAVLAMVLLAGCGDQTASGSTGSQDAAKSAFLAERGGNGTPGVNASGTPIPGGQGGRAPGIFGTVAKVDGDKITVKSQADGTESVVQLASGATIHKQSEAQASDIKEDETVTAIGTKNGDTVEAQTVEIGSGGFGAFGGFGGGGGFVRRNGTPGAGPNGGNGAFPSGTPPAGFGNGQGTQRFRGGNGTGGPNASGTPGVARDFVSGKVAKVDGDTVTVTMDDGTSATFQLLANTRLQKQIEIQITDVKEGNTLVAQGQQNGNIFEATSIQIIEAIPGQTPVP
jgi:preprotein translocase subunit YajC